MEYQMSTVTLPPPPEPEVVRFASGFWRRFWAYLIDALIVLLALYPIRLLLGFGFLEPTHTVGTPYPPSLIVYYLVGGIVAWLYWALMESSNLQATLGKIAMGIVVTDEYGNRISFGRATGRELSKGFSAILFIGFIMAAITKTNQALHDKIARTLVLMKDKKDFILR
jgi:uncharacterized RDD family membrane protein YckC